MIDVLWGNSFTPNSPSLPPASPRASDLARVKRRLSEPIHHGASGYDESVALVSLTVCR